MGYTVDTFDLSMEIGAPMIEWIRESMAEMAVSDCPKCNLQIRQRSGLESVHPIELLAMVYRLTEKSRVEVLLAGSRAPAELSASASGLIFEQVNSKGDKRNSGKVLSR